MNIDKFGAVTLTPDELFEAVYSGKVKHFQNLFTDAETTALFNKSKNINKDNFQTLSNYQPPSENLESFDQANQSNWFMPDEYKNMDIERFLVDQCPEQNYQRLVDELKLFQQYNMMDLLKYLKYLVDTMRKNNIVWGVGRGSSVASYCLYLIGVHKIDSIKYELDIKEFLK